MDKRTPPGENGPPQSAAEQNISEEAGWKTLTLDFTAEEEARINERAAAEGITPNCVVIHAIFRALEDGSGATPEEWRRRLTETLRRNGCPPPS